MPTSLRVPTPLLPSYALYALISPNHAARLRERPAEPKAPPPRLATSRDRDRVQLAGGRRG